MAVPTRTRGSLEVAVTAGPAPLVSPAILPSKQRYHDQSLPPLARPSFAYASTVSEEGQVDGALVLGYMLGLRSACVAASQCDRVLLVHEEHLSSSSITRLKNCGWLILPLRAGQHVVPAPEDLPVNADTYRSSLFGLTQYKRVTYAAPDVLVTADPDGIFEATLPDHTYILAGVKPSHNYTVPSTGWSAVMSLVPSSSAHASLVSQFASAGNLWDRRFDGNLMGLFATKTIPLPQALTAMPMGETMLLAGDIVLARFSTFRPWNSRWTLPPTSSVSMAYGIWWQAYEEMHLHMANADYGHSPNTIRNPPLISAFTPQDPEASWVEPITSYSEAQRNLTLAGLTVLPSTDDCGLQCMSRGMLCSPHALTFSSVQHSLTSFQHLPPTPHTPTCNDPDEVSQEDVAPCDPTCTEYTLDSEVRCRNYLGNISNIERFALSVPFQLVAFPAEGNSPCSIEPMESVLAYARTIKFKAKYRHHGISAILKVPQFHFPFEPYSEWIAWRLDRLLK
eukprot:gene6143-1097_t